MGSDNTARMTPLYMMMETITEAEARAWSWASCVRADKSEEQTFDLPARRPFDPAEAARSNGLELFPGKTWYQLALCYDPARDEAVAILWDTMWWWQRRLPTELLWGWSLLDDPRE